MSKISRIDAHHHFWKIGKYDYPWIEPRGLLDRDFGPEELAPILAQNRIEQSVLVQTIASLDETKWFLKLAETHAWIAGVVGWVDLAAKDVAATLDDLIARHGRRLVGLRHNLHDEPDDHFILREEVCRGLAALTERGLTYDLLIRPRHLPVVLKLIEQLPQLRLVIDHAAKPAIAARGWDDWAAPLAAVSKHSNAFCKLSGLVTEADWRSWRPDDLKPYIEHVIDVFGPQRVMFGSDWPVCLLAATYERVIQAISRNVERLSDSERSRIFGETAAEFYGVDRTLVAQNGTPSVPAKT